MENFKLLKFAPGDVVFHHGERGKHAYLIRSGSIGLYRCHADKTAKIVTRMKPGQILGEMAIITGEPRSATAQAEEATELLAIDDESFQFLLNRSSPFIKALIKQLINRIQTSELNQITELSMEA